MKTKTKKIIVIISAVILLLLITIGASFAYFSASLSGTENTTTITTTGGTMNITFAGGSAITATGIYPSNDPIVTKNFTVTGNNTTAIKMGYSLSLIMDENTFSVGALKYKLTSTNTGANGEVAPAISDAKDLYIGPSTNLLGVGYFNETSGNKVHNYTLNMYFPENGESQNEDQGKSFKAHVGISDMACTDCLKDNILAQGGGANSIKNKANSNFDIISPLGIKYKENLPKEVILNSAPEEIYIGNEYTFDSNTGIYSIPNYTYYYEFEYKVYEPSDIGKYICYVYYHYDWNTSSCTGLYKINSVADGKIVTATEYTSSYYYDISDVGIFKAEDEYGTSYYYRGAKESLKNNLIFAGFQWKIIRVNGDGSIRIIYNGTCPGNECLINSNRSEIDIIKTAYNAVGGLENKYVGYMYGGAAGVASTSREQATTNETSSTIKTAIDNWYATNINGTGYANSIVDNIFCNDRQLQSEVGGPATGTGFGGITTYYSAYYKLVTTKNPTLKCSLKNDRFTVNDNIKGNKALTYPVGLITADEISLAGLKHETQNLDNYLINKGHYSWTMSPKYNNAMHVIGADGSLGGFSNNLTWGGVRPVINLSSTVKIMGDGSISNPYKIV